MSWDTQCIRRELEALAEPSYSVFASKLIPNCSNLIGVRIPQLRRLAKAIVKDAPLDYLEDLADAKTLYFEETMLQGLVIGNLREDIEVVLQEVARFIPKVTNWSLCDSFCNELKIVRQHRARVWAFLTPYFQSHKPYEIRVAVVLLRFHFIDEGYIDALFPIFDAIKHEDYYVKMAVAWALSMCFVKFPSKTMAYLQDNHLDDETYHKTLQKMRESTQVDGSTKARIKGMKRKKNNTSRGR